MPEVDVKNGMFGWTDLSTPDPDGAKEFYGSLFGWSYRDEAAGEMGVYTMCQKGDHPVCGLASQPPQQREAGVPPTWNSYVTVDDVDAVTGRAEELGGNVIMQPMDVMDMGRMSVIQDPTGGALCLWQSKNDQGDSGLFNEHGAMTWNELATRDRERALAFYGDLLGWEYEEMESPGGPYKVIHNDGRPNGGMLQMNDEWPDDVPTHWMVYFWVDDVEASAARVEELGGSIHVAPFDIGVGMMSVVADPQGAVFTLFNAKDGPSA